MTNKEYWRIKWNELNSQMALVRKQCHLVYNELDLGPEEHAKKAWWEGDVWLAQTQALRQILKECDIIVRQERDGE